MKWEYCTEEASNKISITRLNELGEKGWEICGITVDPDTSRLYPKIIAYLKRQKKD